MSWLNNSVLKMNLNVTLFLETKSNLSKLKTPWKAAPTQNYRSFCAPPPPFPSLQHTFIVVAKEIRILDRVTRGFARSTTSTTTTTTTCKFVHS